MIRKETEAKELIVMELTLSNVFSIPTESTGLVQKTFVVFFLSDPKGLFDRLQLWYRKQKAGVEKPHLKQDITVTTEMEFIF